MKTFVVYRHEMRLIPDKRVPFPAHFICDQSIQAKRQMIARIGMSWLRLQKERGAQGFIMFDIDETIVDNNENVIHGFEYMRELFNEYHSKFPIHFVTARPHTDHAYVIDMLAKKKFSISPERLHMLPAEQYNKDEKYTIAFKWETFLEISKMHGGCVARFGDQLWDVAHCHYDNATSQYKVDTSLSHVQYKDCYVYYDPKLKGTMSCKMPGKEAR